MPKSNNCQQCVQFISESPFRHYCNKRPAILIALPSHITQFSEEKKKKIPLVSENSHFAFMLGLP